MDYDLLALTEYGGCSSKIPAKLLEEVLGSLPLSSDPNILVDIDTQDDAGVYRVSDELALVFTTDFFPPVCSDPYEFGQVAAANSISDVYAMGGDPVIGLNIMMFPSGRLPARVYSDILRGGADKAAEAGVSLIGGHTIDDFPPKYGLAVIGYVHPDRVITNSGARPGDILILTKPIGTGVIMAGARLNMSTDADVDEAKAQMKLLNRSGASVMKKFGIRGATDVTGFGLAGHALRMARASRVTVSLSMKAVPLIGNAWSLMDAGCIPGASFRNLEYADPDTDFSDDLDYNLRMLAFDAQTSGGLLISAPRDRAEDLLGDLLSSGLQQAAIIGEVKDPGRKLLVIGN